MDKKHLQLANKPTQSGDERTCNECKIIKPITEFYKRKDDFTKRCKECVCQSERLRYTIKNVENGTYECYEVGLDEIPQELSLPELKALMKQHNIQIKPHSNKPDIVEVLKQQGILPLNYINGLRRVTPPIAPTRPSRACPARSVSACGDCT